MPATTPQPGAPKESWAIVALNEQPLAQALAPLPLAEPELDVRTEVASESLQIRSVQAETLFVAVRELLRQLLKTPMKDADIAAALDVSNAQAKAWLQRLLDEGAIEKQKKSAAYVVKKSSLFE